MNSFSQVIVTFCHIPYTTRHRHVQPHTNHLSIRRYQFHRLKIFDRRDTITNHLKVELQIK